MMKRILVAGGLLEVLLFAGAPKADAGVGFSFGIGLPGFTYYQSDYPAPVRYYAPPVYGGYGYSGSYSYGGGDAREYDDGSRHRSRHGWLADDRRGWRRHCGRRY